MKKSILFAQFSTKETLSVAQSAKVKGGDDKHPPLPLPGTDPLPRPNSNQNAQGNNNQQ